MQEMRDNPTIPFVSHHFVFDPTVLPPLQSKICSQNFLLLHSLPLSKSYQTQNTRWRCTDVRGRPKRCGVCQKLEGARHVVAREDPVHMQTHQGMSLYVLTAGEQLAADVAAERAHTWVDDQMPLECATVLGDVVAVGALELIEG